jgi:hypothetical protein
MYKENILWMVIKANRHHTNLLSPLEFNLKSVTYEQHVRTNQELDEHITSESTKKYV